MSGEVGADVSTPKLLDLYCREGGHGLGARLEYLLREYQSLARDQEGLDSRRKALRQQWMALGPLQRQKLNKAIEQWEETRDGLPSSS